MKTGTRILIATGSFKDVYSPMEACDMISTVLETLDANGALDLKTVPLADGGEYSMDVLQSQGIGERVDVGGVVSPTGEKVDGAYLRLDDKSAFVAASAVLHMGPELSRFKNPLNLTTYGLGQLIDDALERGASHIYLALGGTSTVDAGIGIAQALGARLLDGHGTPLVPTTGDYFTGRDLGSVADVDMKPIAHKTSGVSIEVLGDACIDMTQMHTPTNQKISRDFDDQREQIVSTLEHSLREYARVIQRTTQSTESLETLPFTGVAGGILLTVLALFKTKASLGVDFFLNALDVKSRMQQCDLVITGEGRFDNSLGGKTPVGVSRLAKRCGKEVVLVCGDVADDLKPCFSGHVCGSPPKALAESGLTSVVSFHNFFKEFKGLSDEHSAVTIYRQHTPEILAQALREVLFQRGI